MLKIKARDGDVRYIRISKAQARKAFDAGKAMWFCPCKLYPFGGWRPACLINPADYAEAQRPFDTVVRDFESYNCTCNETGTYAAFYIADALP